MHRCSYNTVDAVQMMKANDVLLLTDNAFISLKEAKNFAKGVKYYGKHFYKLKKEYLPLHQTVIYFGITAL